ncbi:MAG: electron transfer flavoprotein subunit beta/FixA family protein [Propionibacteriaceae bacterium]|nr:electron transfer flavoprotein subunit beta/FixA family protein [Propionibacteriaceae bacterium]
MRIIVLIKEVPDTYGERHLNLHTGLVERAGAERVLDEICERAVEAALTIAEANPSSHVTVVSMGPASATESIRKALAMGADEAVHVVDDALEGADLMLTAQVLASVIRRREVDLVLTGNASTDGGGGVMGALVAEVLGLPQATHLSSIRCDGVTVRGTRNSDAGQAIIEASLPAVASITEALPDPRFPGLKGIMAAKKKPVETCSATDLGVDTSGQEAGHAINIAVSARPPRSVGVTITDEGDGGVRLAHFLIEHSLA